MDFGLGLVLSFTDNATAGINNTVNSLGRLTQIAEDASTSLNQMASLSALSVVSSQVGNSFTTMGSTILSTLSQVISKVNDTGQTLMYAENQLDALYSSSGKTGKEVIGQIQEYAKTSMFEFENLIPAVTSLKSVGIEAFNSITSSTGNAKNSLLDYASALASFAPQMRNAYGIGINAAIGAMREYIAEGNAMSLKRGAGLDITGILGEDKGETIEERTRQVADLIESLGMMSMVDAMKDNPMTQLSNMGDTLFQLLGMIANEGGVYSKFTQLIGKLSSYVMAIPDEELENIAKNIGSALVSIMNPLEKGIDKLLSFVDVIRTLIANNPKLIKFVTIGASVAGVLLILSGVALKVTSALSGLSLMFIASGKTFSSLGGIFKIGIAKILSTLLPLVAIAGVLYFAWKNDFAGIRTMTTSFVSNVVSSFSTAKQAISGSVDDMINTLDELREKGDFFSNFTLSIMKVMQVIKSIAEAWNDNTLSEDNYQKAKELGVLPLIESVLDLKYRFDFFKKGFIDGWKEIGDKVKNFITGFAENLDGTMFQTLIDGVAILLEKLASGDTQAWYDFGKSFAEFTANAVAFMIALKGLEKVLGFFAKIATVITGVSKIGGFIGKAFGGLWKIVSKIFPNISGLLKGVVEVFKLFLGGAGTFAEAMQVVFTPFSGIMSLITGIAMAVTGFVKQLIDGFSGFWEIIKWIGIALGVVGSIILGASTLPAVIIGAIVGALTTLIVVIKDNWEKIKTFFSTLGAWIYNNVIKPVADFFVNLWEGIVTGVTTAFDSVMSFLSGIPEWFNTNVIQPVVTFFSNLWNGIVTGVESAVNSVKNFFSTIASWIFNNVIQPVVNFFMTYIFPFIEKIAEIVAKIVEIIVVLVGVGIKFLIQKVKDFIQNVIAIVQSIASWIYTNVIQPIANFFVSLWNGIVTGVQNAITFVKNFFSTVASWIYNNVIQPVANFFTNLWNGIVTGVATFIENAKTLIGAIVSWINNNIIIPVATFFSDLWSGIVNGIAKFIEDAKAVFTTIVDWIKTTIIEPIAGFFKGLWEDITYAFGVIADTISGVLKSAINRVLRGIGNIINGVIWGINKAIDVINAIPGVSITRITELDIPQLAKGGVVDRPMMSMIGEAGKEAVVPLENNTEWTGQVANLLSSALRDRTHDTNTYGALVTVITSCVGVMNKLMSVVSSIDNNGQEPTQVPTPVSTQNTTNANRTNTSSYMTSNNNSNTYQGDTDNSVTFEAGSIVIQSNGSSDAEAERLAKKIMAYIKRQKELEKMLNYG